MYLFRLATLIAAAFAFAACADTPTTPEMGGRVVVYEGGGDGPIKPEPPKPDTATPPQPELPGALEITGRPAIITDGICPVSLTAWARGGPVAVERTERQAQRLGEPLDRNVVRTPGWAGRSTILPGTSVSSRRLLESVAVTGPTDVVYTILRADGEGPAQYRVACR